MTPSPRAGTKMSIRVGINGFGRIGRLVMRAAQTNPNISIVPSVWKSNFGRPTPSRRYCPRNCICSMAWRFYAIDATLSPWPRRLDGVEAHEDSRNISQDNLTHWLISTQVRGSTSSCAPRPSTTTSRRAWTSKSLPVESVTTAPTPDPGPLDSDKWAARRH